MFAGFTYKTDVQLIKNNGCIGVAYKTNVKTNKTNKTNDLTTKSSGRGGGPGVGDDIIGSINIIIVYIGFISKSINPLGFIFFYV